MAKIFFNRRSGRDRRQQQAAEQDAPFGRERRSIDRRLYDNNDYLVVIGSTRGIDYFTLLILMPALVVALTVLIMSPGLSA